MSYDPPVMGDYEAYKLVVRSTRLLFEGENTCLAAVGHSALREAFPDPPENARGGRIGELAGAWVDRLVTLRIIANSQAIPLIADGDVDTVISMIQDRGEVDPAATTQLRRVLGITFYTFAIGLSVVGRGDKYEGFNLTAHALVAAALELGVDPSAVLNPERALEATEFRSAAFRHCMSPEHWQTFADLHIDLLEREGSGNSTLANARTAMARLSREYFENRKYEIWPNHND